MVTRAVLAFLFLTFCTIAEAETSNGDSLTVSRPAFSDHLSYELRYNPGRVIALDEYVRKWLKKGNTFSVSAELHYNTLPADSNSFAADYGYPTFTLGLRYNRNHGTVLHRDKDSAWGLLEPVDYNTILGDIITVYGTFSRPLLRTRRWEVAYYLGTGIGFALKHYNLTDQIDNEFIGTVPNIYFTAGLSATYHISPMLAIRAGVDFSHHSNGALYRPNKGANYVGPFVGIVYYNSGYDSHTTTSPSEDKQEHQSPAPNHQSRKRFARHFFGEVTLGVGGKTLLEDWQLTQFNTPPGDPDYRTDRFHFYMAYSLQAGVLYRYARRWASGLGLDLFYGTYSDRVAQLDASKGITMRHSPWSLGIAARHEVFYGRLSLRMALGYYLYRHMGSHAKQIEKPYYERIGLHYQIPGCERLSVGFNVNAHLTKADFTELQLSYRVF